MKQFNLFITFHKPDSFKEVIAAFRMKHMAEHNCEVCGMKNNCPIKNDQIDVNAALFTDADNFLEMKKTIDHLYYANFSENIILFDYKKDMAYIYKAKGSLTEIKKNILPPIVAMYEVLRKEAAFFEIEDVRLTMMGFGNKAVAN